MISRLQQRLRRHPGAARLVSVAGLLLIAAAATLGVRSGVASCGPQTSGPACTAENAGWGVLLAVGVLAATVAGSGVLWPLPAIWTVAALLSTARGDVGSTTFVVAATAVGLVALGAAIWVDVSPRARQRRARRDR
ncbi:MULTISPECIES: hypothetical protein [Curtobacterium]|uniref:hypothetical protein n=1 Tax=Curtobacterium flaccumfaciens TaxID=2035 RepID=UPI003EE5E2FC